MRKRKKLLMILLILVVAIVVFGILIQIYVTNKNKVDHGSNPVVYSKGEKTAIVLYQPAVIAKGVDNIVEMVVQQLNDDGYTVTVDYVGSHVPTDLSQYDVAIIGSPTYMRNISPVVTNTIKNITNYGENPNVNFFVVGMLKDSPELEDVKELIGDNLNTSIKFSGVDSKLKENVTDWIKTFD